jgi:hypothetical protein
VIEIYVRHCFTLDEWFGGRDTSQILNPLRFAAVGMIIGVQGLTDGVVKFGDFLESLRVLQKEMLYNMYVLQM